MLEKILITGLVVVHLGVTLWHGDAHARLVIDMPPEKDAFIYVVILAAPLIAAGLVWTRHFSLSLWLFTLSMLGALLFGAYHHYVLVSPDNIEHLPAGGPHLHGQFIDSAAALALLELGSVLYGMFCLGAARVRSRERPPR